MKAKGRIEDIKFLKKCKSNNVVPKFVKVNCVVDNDRTRKVTKAAKKHWINLEIKHHHKVLQTVERESYLLRTRILTTMNDFEWNIFDERVSERVNEKQREKKSVLARKFEKLIECRNKSRGVRRRKEKSGSDQERGDSDTALNKSGRIDESESGRIEDRGCSEPEMIDDFFS